MGQRLVLTKLNTMLLAALKLQVAALVTVAGVNTDDISNKDVKGILEILDKDIKAVQAQGDKADPAAANKALQGAFEAIQKLAAAENADKDALYIMGLWARGGLLSGASGQQVLDFYERAASAGQVNAKVDLAQIILQTFAQDPARIKQAGALLEEAEKTGNNAARFILANFKLNGQAGFATDAEGAKKLLDAGSAAGDGACTFGLYQLVGRGVSVADEKGEQKEIVKKDLPGAVKLLEQAVTQGHPAAMTEYASVLLAGNNDLGITKDVTKAIKVYTDAADKGNGFANRQLAIMHEQGSVDGVAKDNKKALEFFGKAANANDPAALLWLGNASQTGWPADAAKPEDRLVPQNSANALSLYRQAAVGGVGEALFNVGVYYENGVLVDKDPAKAFSLYHRAALGGLPVAMFKVGGFYQEGTSVAQDPVAAVGWYQRAAAAGLPQANFVMGSVSLTNGAPTQAISFFENAALAGMPQAMAAIAGVYNNGAGTGDGSVPKNPKLAYVYASLASEAAAQDESIKKAVEDIFGKLSATDKEDAKKLLAAKKKDMEERRKGPAAAAETPAPATTSPKGKGK